MRSKSGVEQRLSEVLCVLFDVEIFPRQFDTSLCAAQFDVIFGDLGKQGQYDIGTILYHGSIGRVSGFNRAMLAAEYIELPGRIESSLPQIAVYAGPKPSRRYTYWYIVATVVTSIQATRINTWKLVGANDDQTTGIKILARSIEEPLRQIVANAGEDAAVVLNRVREGKGTFGYNAATGEYGDMIEMGILDPTKVTRLALQNAASVAGLLLTTEVMIAESPKEDGHSQVAPGGGMGGMDM